MCATSSCTRAFSKYSDFVRITWKWMLLCLVTIPKWTVYAWHLVVECASVRCFPTLYYPKWHRTSWLQSRNSIVDDISGSGVWLIALEVLPHPSYNLNLASSDFHFFALLKSISEYNRFSYGWRGYSWRFLVVQRPAKRIICCWCTEACS